MTSNGSQSKSSSRSKAPANDVSTSGSQAVHPETNASATLASGTASPPGVSVPGGDTNTPQSTSEQTCEGGNPAILAGGSMFASEPADLEAQYAKAYPKSYAFLKPLEDQLVNGGDNPVLRITAKVDDFRRAGFKFSTTPRDVSMAQIEFPEQLEALLSEAELTVELL